MPNKKVRSINVKNVAHVEDWLNGKLTGLLWFLFCSLPCLVGRFLLFLTGLLCEGMKKTRYLWYAILTVIGVFWINNKTNYQPEAYRPYVQEPPSLSRNQKSRTFHLKNIAVPVYSGSASYYKRFKMDLTIIANSKHTKEFFVQRLYILRDLLNVNIEPVSSEFLFTPEGKRTISGKVKREMNALIKKHRGPGKVESVYIRNFITG